MYDTLLSVATNQQSFHSLKKSLQQWTKTFSSIQGLLVMLEMHEFTIAKLVDCNLELKKQIIALALNFHPPFSTHVRNSRLYRFWQSDGAKEDDWISCSSRS